VAMTQTELLKAFPLFPRLLVHRQEPRKRFGKIFGSDPHTDSAAKRLARTHAAAQENLKALALDSVDRGDRSLQPHVAYMMLAAGVRASGHTDSDRLFKLDFSCQVTRQLDSPVLCFRHRQLAKLDAGAGDDSFACPARPAIKAGTLDL